MPARRKSVVITGPGLQVTLSPSDCALIAAALDIVNPDDSEDTDNIGRARYLAEVFRDCA
jgi:hypothetical protein